MGISRRKMVLGSGLGVVGLGLGVVFTRRIDDEIYRVLRRNFGKRIAKSGAAGEFVADIAALWNGHQSARNQILLPTMWMFEGVSPLARKERTGFEANVLEVFLRSTNAVRAYETGTQELEYLGIWSPKDSPCANMFSAAWV